MSPSPLVWLVTGCSSGFGEHFVHSIIARGDHVIATARKLDTITHLQQAGATILPLDLTDSQQAINSTVAQAVKVHGRIDVLVNNASYVQIGVCEDLEDEDLVAQFDTNVFGTLKVTRAVLPYFRQVRSGTTVFISSLSGWVGHAGCGAYAGSKFALEGFAESLHAETAPLGLRTLLIEPGRFRTKLLSSKNIKARGPSTIPEYAEESRELLDYISKESEQQPGDARKLVEIVLDLVRQEGVAKGRVVPFRLPLGRDCLEEIEDKLRVMGGLLDEWRDVITSTDIAA